MKQYYYYKALRKTITQFLDMFNDIKIARYTQKGVFDKYIEVPLKFGMKEKIWYWLNERKDDEMLPIISVTMSSIEYSLERATNKYRSICVSQTDGGDLTRFLNPVPYDISFQVGIWGLYMTDIDQILEQILPYFQPYVFMRLYIEELDATFDVKVIFTSATPETELEWTDDNFRVLKWTLEFQVQTYLFRPVETVGTIGKIYLNYYTNETTFNARDNSSTFTSGASGETQRFVAISAGATPEDHFYTYELFQFGNRIGRTQALGVSAAYMETKEEFYG